MKTFVLLLAAVLSPATVAAAADVAVAPVVGKMLYSTGGKRLAPVYKIDATGAPLILLDGRQVMVPAATLSEVEGRVETSLTRKDLATRR